MDGGGNGELSGGEGNDKLIGGGEDWLDGGACNDKVKSGGGVDTLIFDFGSDRLVDDGNWDFGMAWTHWIPPPGTTSTSTSFAVYSWH